MCFCCGCDGVWLDPFLPPAALLPRRSLGEEVILLGVVDEEEGLLMLYSRLAGGPTGTMREPNSTPMVTSWWDTKRPSQSLIVSYHHQHCRATPSREGPCRVTALTPSN